MDNRTYNFDNAYERNHLMGRHKKVVDIDISSDEENLPLRRVTSQLAGRYLKHFSEETYNKSLHAAFTWAQGVAKREKYTIELVDYFKQIKGNKCIFVSYNTKVKIEEDTN